MIRYIRNSPSLLVITFTILLCITGCKSKKKAMEAQAAAEKARVEREAAEQRQKEAELKKQRDAEEAARREADAKREAEQARTREPRAKLNDYFNMISSSSSMTAANSSINEALSLFASADTPVLIVISESGGQKDYDRPTTIKAYLNYLKDQKKNMNQISDMKFDNTGKITELELRKNY